MDIIFCARCGKRFEAHHGGQKYCSPVCAYEAELERKRIARKLPKPVSERGTKVCKYCGKEFKIRNVAEQYCSADCKKSAKKAHDESYRKPWLEQEKRAKASHQSISEVVMEAKAHGMSYGEYLAWRREHPND